MFGIWSETCTFPASKFGYHSWECAPRPFTWNTLDYAHMHTRNIISRVWKHDPWTFHIIFSHLYSLAKGATLYTPVCPIDFPSMFWLVHRKRKRGEKNYFILMLISRFSFYFSRLDGSTHVDHGKLNWCLWVNIFTYLFIVVDEPTLPS